MFAAVQGLLSSPSRKPKDGSTPKTPTKVDAVATGALEPDMKLSVGKRFVGKMLLKSSETSTGIGLDPLIKVLVPFIRDLEDFAPFRDIVTPDILQNVLCGAIAGFKERSKSRNLHEVIVALSKLIPQASTAPSVVEAQGKVKEAMAAADEDLLFQSQQQLFECEIKELQQAQSENYEKRVEWLEAEKKLAIAHRNLKIAQQEKAKLNAAKENEEVVDKRIAELTEEIRQSKITLSRLVILPFILALFPNAQSLNVGLHVFSGDSIRDQIYNNITKPENHVVFYDLFFQQSPVNSYTFAVETFSKHLFPVVLDKFLKDPSELIQAFKKYVTARFPETNGFFGESIPILSALIPIFTSLPQIPELLRNRSVQIITALLKNVESVSSDELSNATGIAKSVHLLARVAGPVLTAPLIEQNSLATRVRIFTGNLIKISGLKGILAKFLLGKEAEGKAKNAACSFPDSLEEDLPKWILEAWQKKSIKEPGLQGWLDPKTALEARKKEMGQSVQGRISIALSSMVTKKLFTNLEKSGQDPQEVEKLAKKLVESLLSFVPEADRKQMREVLLKPVTELVQSALVGEKSQAFRTFLRCHFERVLLTSFKSKSPLTLCVESAKLFKQAEFSKLAQAYHAALEKVRTDNAAVGEAQLKVLVQQAAESEKKKLLESVLEPLSKALFSVWGLDQSDILQAFGLSKKLQKLCAEYLFEILLSSTTQKPYIDRVEELGLSHDKASEHSSWLIKASRILMPNMLTKSLKTFVCSPDFGPFLRSMFELDEEAVKFFRAEVEAFAQDPQFAPVWEYVDYLFSEIAPSTLLNWFISSKGQSSFPTILSASVQKVCSLVFSSDNGIAITEHARLVRQSRNEIVEHEAKLRALQAQEKLKAQLSGEITASRERESKYLKELGSDFAALAKSLLGILEVSGENPFSGLFVPESDRVWKNIPGEFQDLLATLYMEFHPATAEELRKELKDFYHTNEAGEMCRIIGAFIRDQGPHVLSKNSQKIASSLFKAFEEYVKTLPPSPSRDELLGHLQAKKNDMIQFVGSNIKDFADKGISLKDRNDSRSAELKAFWEKMGSFTEIFLMKTLLKFAKRTRDLDQDPDFLWNFINNVTGILLADHVHAVSQGVQATKRTRVHQVSAQRMISVFTHFRYNGNAERDILHPSLKPIELSAAELALPLDEQQKLKSERIQQQRMEHLYKPLADMVIKFCELDPSDFPGRAHLFKHVKNLAPDILELLYEEGPDLGHLYDGITTLCDNVLQPILSRQLLAEQSFNLSDRADTTVPGDRRAAHRVQIHDSWHEIAQLMMPYQPWFMRVAANRLYVDGQPLQNAIVARVTHNVEPFVRNAKITNMTKTAFRACVESLVPSATWDDGGNLSVRDLDLRPSSVPKAIPNKQAILHKKSRKTARALESTVSLALKGASYSAQNHFYYDRVVTKVQAVFRFIFRGYSDRINRLFQTILEVISFTLNIPFALLALLWNPLKERWIAKYVRHSVSDLSHPIHENLSIQLVHTFLENASQIKGREKKSL